MTKIIDRTKTMAKTLLTTVLLTNITWAADPIEDKLINPDIKLKSTLYEEALGVEKTKELALKGDGKKQYDLAYYYHHGTYVEKDLAKAKEWYLRAATTENTQVRNKIARLYQIGVVLPKDDVKAFEHYSYSAENGDANAQGNLAVLYWQGVGIEKNIPKGIEWAEKAAAQGSIKAKLNLGAFYNSTVSGQPDTNKALKWYQSAAEQGSHLGSLAAGKLYLKLQQFDKAHYYLSESADLYNSEAMLLLAMVYAKGLGLPVNQEKSIALLKESERLGNEDAGKILAKFNQ